MGDICDMNDVTRFARSARGQAYLEEIRSMLKGRTIVDVTFTNEVRSIVTTLVLNDNSTFASFQPSLEVDALREAFGDVIQEEYFKDYPERRKKRNRS